MISVFANKTELKCLFSQNCEDLSWLCYRDDLYNIVGNEFQACYFPPIDVMSHIIHI